MSGSAEGPHTEESRPTGSENCSLQTAEELRRGSRTGAETVNQQLLHFKKHLHQPIPTCSTQSEKSARCTKRISPASAHSHSEIVMRQRGIPVLSNQNLLRHDWSEEPALPAPYKLPRSLHIHTAPTCRSTSNKEEQRHDRQQQYTAK